MEFLTMVRHAGEKLADGCRDSAIFGRDSERICDKSSREIDESKSEKAWQANSEKKKS
jgi:hypothetical protein